VTTGPTGAYVPAYNNLRTNNAATRSDPNRWDAKRDDNAGAPIGSGYYDRPSGAPEDRDRF
jgi:curli production assembly/transport component CsgG/holdfast attachment protein HfaB